MTATLTAAPYAARGDLSDALLTRLTGGPDDADLDALADRALVAADLLTDDVAQLALFTLYALSYGSFPAFGDRWEWSPELLRLRGRLEEAFEAEVRACVPVPPLPRPVAADVAAALFTLTAPTPGPGLARYVAKRASAEQAREFLALRSIYTLREADPHSWAVPRLTGRAKAALVEIQADEYGGGDPDRVHATIFARTMRGAGLSDRYGDYVDQAPAVVLASHNLMSLFGFNLRLRGAIVGHLAAFEMTSSIPNRFYAEGFRRLGFGPDVTEYFDEHVEADAVHEQIAAHDLAGALAEDEPDLLPDIMFGAAACLAADDWVGDHVSAAWDAGRSALRRPLPGTTA